MFDIGWGEFLVIGIVALIAIGPKELPGVLRALGQWMGKIRRMASEFQSQFQEAMREAEMADLKKTVDETTQGLSAHFDPLDYLATETKPADNAAPAPPPTDAAAALAAPASEPPTPQPAAEAQAETPAEQPSLPLPEPASAPQPTSAPAPQPAPQVGGGRPA